MTFTKFITHDVIWKSACICAERLATLAGTSSAFTDQHLHRMVSTIKDPVDNALSRIILDASQRAERRSAFSSGLTLHTLVNLLKKSSMVSKQEQLEYSKNIQSELGEKNQEIVNSARIPSEIEFNYLLQKFVPDTLQRSLVNEIICQGGLDGKFTIEVGKNGVKHPVIESTLGYNFLLNSPIEENEWERYDVKIFIVDGMIEQVHEIHHMLEMVSKKFPLIIVAREFGEEVLHTLKTNKLRGTLDILPICVPVEVDTMNTLKDIAVICSSDIISSAKGQLTSGAKIEDLSTLAKVNFKQGLLTITDDRNSSFVNSHRIFLQSLRDAATPEIGKLYERRMKTLSPNHTLIKLPSTYDELSVETFAQNISSGLRLIKSIHEAGVYDKNGVCEVVLRSVISNNFAASQLSVISSFDSMLIQD